jgi:periplasmic glucans biosynthesis protein
MTVDDPPAGDAMSRSADRIRICLQPVRALGLALLLAVPLLAEAFDFDDVVREAAALARQPYQAVPTADARLAALSYDDYRDIRFRPESALWRDSGSLFHVHFFALGRGHVRPLRLFELQGGEARALQVPASHYTVGRVAASAADGALQPLPGAAGWRVSFPLNVAGQHDEVIAFLGASYFRAIGTRQVYGLSARGLAVDTAGGEGEEFPDFTAFWLERPASGAREMRFFALLDSPRVAGAYRFVLRPGSDTVLEVRARLFLRAPVTTLGIAPLTSMFLAGENQPVAHDYRPEVHDSDGLLVASGDGEQIWRPLSNPAQPFVTSFALPSLRGFGLMQRDRAFTSYADLEAHYQRRPSAWIEPLGDWGPGRVELLQFGTPDETHDNIAAYWVPASTPPAGAPIDIAWRVRWALGDPPASGLARVLQTRRGHGFRPQGLPPQRQQFHVDFTGPSLQGLDDSAAMQALASGNANVSALHANAYPNPERGGWRVSLEFDRLDKRQPVELRLQLRLAGKLLSETWAYALAPE